MFQNNYPDQITSRMAEFKKSGYFPTFPFGIDLTNDEIVLAKTLKALKGKLSRPSGAIGAIKQAIEIHSIPDTAKPYLERLQLLEAHTLQEKMVRKLIIAELTAEGYI